MTEDRFVSEQREQISAIDRELLDAFNRRLEVVRRLHDYKLENGIPLRDPGREGSLLQALVEANGGPLSDEGVEALFHQVLALTRKELHGE